MRDLLKFFYLNLFVFHKSASRMYSNIIFFFLYSNIILISKYMLMVNVNLCIFCLSLNSLVERVRLKIDTSCSSWSALVFKGEHEWKILFKRERFTPCNHKASLSAQVVYKNSHMWRAHHVWINGDGENIFDDRGKCKTRMAKCPNYLYTSFRKGPQQLSPSPTPAHKQVEIWWAQHIWPSCMYSQG